VDDDHSYGQVARELELFAGKVFGHIILHDVDEVGVMKAIVEFLRAHPEWEKKETVKDLNPLIVLERL